MQTTNAPTPKLPVWRTIGLAYRSLLDHPGAAIRCSWAWLLLMTPVVFAVSWLMWLVTSPIDAKVAAAGSAFATLTSVETIVLYLSSWVDSIVMLPALCAIAVAWHRLLLLGEAPRSTNLRFGPAAIGYLAFSAFLMALQIAAASGMTAPLFLGTVKFADGLAWFGVSFVLLIITGLFIAPRLSLYLPALALQHEVRLGDVWRVTRGNTLRLAFGTLLTFVPLFAALIVVGLAMFRSEGQTSVAVSSVGVFWGTALTTFIAVAFLSYAYRHFVQQPPRTAQHLS